MVRRKTAALFDASANSGGVLGGANRDQVKHLGRYGLYVGVAFQLIDDALGLTADEAVLGKPIGSDIREGKRTLVIIHALKKASDGQRRKILGTLGNKHASIEQIQETIDLIRSLGSIDYAEKRAEEFVKRSKMALSRFPETEDKEDLIKLADLITTRKY
jgi:geranylgeranyl diphosphate synthase type I